MISPNQCFGFALLLCALALPAGCADQSEETEVQLPDWLAEDETKSSDPQEPPSQPQADAIGSPTAATAEGHLPVGSDVRPATSPLQAGERFPLRKIVEQQLQQSSLDGQPQVSRSRLELLLTLTVADVREGHTLMQVQFDRVQYSHDAAGELVEYDSARPPASLPQAVLAYHGMVGDGFAWWVGPGNEIVQVVGVREFVDRCLAHVPPQQREQAMLALDASAGTPAVAQFVDETIGLLPRQSEQVPGAGWEETQHIAAPAPMQVNTTYTLTNVTDQSAEVAIRGNIVPSTPLGPGAPATPVEITVNGGSSSGHCVIDRHSGLPASAQVEQVVDMTVRMEGGVEFAQQKRTFTTIETLAPQGLAAHDGRPQFR